MTSAEMQEEFLILYDKITNFDAPGYDAEEISRFLTKAQERLVLHIMNPLGNKYVTGFEYTEKRRKDLSELVRNVNLNTSNVSGIQDGVKPNGTFFDMPSDFLYTLDEEVLTSSATPCFDGNRIEVKPITHNDYTKNKRNPFKKPNDGLVWRMDFSKLNATGPKRHELITDGTYTISNYYVRYMRRPQPIITADLTGITGTGVDGVTAVTNCELDAITHRSIIDEAVAIATGITTPEIWQLKRSEATLSE